MMQITSGARFVKNAPDKLRILEALIKNKSIDEGIAQLSFSGRIASKSLILVLKQLKAQIKDKDLEIDGFKVKSLQVDEGPKLKRRRIRQQGRSTAILKRMSHIKIVIDDGKKEKPALNDRRERNGS